MNLLERLIDGINADIGAVRRGYSIKLDTFAAILRVLCRGVIWRTYF